MHKNATAPEVNHNPYLFPEISSCIFQKFSFAISGYSNHSAIGDPLFLSLYI